MEKGKAGYSLDQWSKERWASRMLIPTRSGPVASLGPFSGLVGGMVGCAGPLQGKAAQ